MNLKNIFLGILIAFSGFIYPFTFSNPFASSFKEPTHEECRQWAYNKLYLGATLFSVSIVSLISMASLCNLTAESSLSSTLAIDSFPLILKGFSYISFGIAGYEYYQFRNPEATAQWIATLKQQGYIKETIEPRRKLNTVVHNVLHDKQLYVGIAAAVAGYLISFTERDHKNPALILTVAGMGIVAEKVISEFRK